MINQDTKLNINGRTISMESLIAKYGIEDMDQAIYTANLLVKQGKATIVTKISAEQQLILDVIARDESNSIVEELDREVEENKAFKRDEAIADTDLIKIGLNFATTPEAITAERWINDLGIDDTELKVKKGVITLIVNNISPKEYSKISNKYQMEKAIKTSVDVTSKVFNGTTNAINYGATEVIAPIAKIAGEAGMNLGKGVVHTGIKVGSGLINSGAKAIVDTKLALETDPEMLRAGKQLRDAKDNALSFWKSKMNKSKSRSGVNILD